jgi:hypothetical protein
MIDVTPYTEQQLFGHFHKGDGFGRHLLILYSLAVGLKAQCILDLGLGSTTRALRLAAKDTGGVVYSCDCDIARFSSLTAQLDASWKLFLGPSEKFISSITQPIDLVCHDAAHDYLQVKLDLSLLLPKMRKFGIICVHDTQQCDLAGEMLTAVRESLEGRKFSVVTIPFNCGLTIIRIEEGILPEIKPSGTRLDDGRLDTCLREFPVEFAEKTDLRRRTDRIYWLSRYIGWRKRKLTKGW